MVAYIPSVITLVVLLITFVFGYGKLSQKIDSLSKDVDRIEKQSRTDYQRIESKIDQLNQNFIEHLKNHP